MQEPTLRRSSKNDESTVKIDCEEIAMKSMGRSNKISVAALHQAASKHGSAGQKLLTRLETIDRNGDGELDAAEVIALLNDKADLRRDKKMLIWAGAVVLVLVLFLCAIIVGLTAVVVIKVKDTEVSNTNNYYIMKAKGTDQTVQVANEDMKVVDGTLITRNSDPGRKQVLGTSSRRIGWMPTGAISQAALLSIRTIGIFPTPKTFLHVDVVGTMALPADNTTPNASYVFFTHMGAIRLSKDTRMLLNSEVLDYLEQRGIPTCRNPTGNGTVLSKAPLCDIMPPKATSRRRLLESWSELSGHGHGYSVHDDNEDIMHLGIAN